MTHLGFASGHGIRTIDRKPEGMSWRSTEKLGDMAITTRSTAKDGRLGPFASGQAPQHLITRLTF